MTRRWRLLLPILSALISAIGMSLFLQNYVLLAQTSDFLPFPNLIPDLNGTFGQLFLFNLQIHHELVALFFQSFKPFFLCR